MVVTYTIIISMSFVITASFLSYWFQNYYFEQRKEQLETEAQFIEDAAVEYLQGNISLDKINETLTYIGNYLNSDIWLIDNYGYVYAVSNRDIRIL